MQWAQVWRERSRRRKAKARAVTVALWLVGGVLGVYLVTLLAGS